MGELIYIRDFIQAKRQARRRAEMRQAIFVLEAAVEYARLDYEFAPLDERLVRARKIRQLEEVVAYARSSV